MSKLRNRVILVAFVLLMVFPFNTFAAQKSFTVDVLEFNNVEKEVLSRSQTVLNNSSDYGDLVFLNDIGAVGDKDLFKAAIGTEMGNYLVVWAAESMFVSFNTLSQSIEDMQAKKVLLEKQLEAAKVQERLGMITANARIDTEKAFQEMELGLDQLQKSRQSIKENMNTMLGQEYNHAVVIKDVPDVSKETILTIDPDKDYLTASSMAYKVKQEFKEQRKEDEKRKFKSSFYRAYQNVLDKQNSLELESKKMEISANNHKTCLLKYDLGMMSSLQYQAQYSSYLTQKMAVEKAKDELFKAYRAYQWATRGLIVN